MTQPEFNFIPDTQREAWSDLQENIGDKQRKVFDVIKNSDSGVALFQIANRLNWPINRVSGRVTELKNASLIEDSGKRVVNPDSGKKAIVWKVSQMRELHKEDNKWIWKDVEK